MSCAVLIEPATAYLISEGKNEPRVNPTSEQDDFSRWRPAYHIIAPHGWMNDPCAPGYDPTTRQYHVGFQWNPNGAEWGDIVWGNSTSSDLVSWKTAPKPTISRDTAYDHAGVFTGCFRATAPNGAHDGTLTYIYTAVSKLPIHYTLPYSVGCEKLAIATSQDGGKTWTKPQCNPVLAGPPKDISVTGWRDPYVAPWASMSKALGPKYEEGTTLFATISGGVVGKTPTVFLYAVSASDLTEWEYIGPVMDVGLNHSPSHWSGDLGVNWEVTNFMTLKDNEGASQDVLILGAEGCKSMYRQKGSKRTPRGQLWVAGQIKSQENRTTADSLVDYQYGGIFDHGLLYAANGFWDPMTQQQVVIGWVVEDDLPVDLQVRQQWSGCLSLPRVASLLTIRNVRRARKSDLKSLTSIQAEADAHGTSTVRTMKISPDRRLQQLRSSAKQTTLPVTALGPLTETKLQVPLKSCRWEVSAEFAVAQTCERVGMTIYHSEGMPLPHPASPFECQDTKWITDLESRTELYWSPAEEDFAVERPDLVTAEASVKFQAEHAPHTLFTMQDVSTGKETEEKLRVHAFYDGSVLEMFVNERTVVTTRIYTTDARCVGLAFFAESGVGAHESAAVITECSAWDGLSCA